VQRPYELGIAALLALALIAASPQRLVGDGREYLAQAINFASLHGPGLRPRDLDAIRSEMARFDPALAAWDIRGATIPDARRNRDFPHFWFYALLAAPGVWLTRLFDAPPTLAFTALNLTLLGVALWAALPRIGAAACILLFASPIVWWIDKAHTEVFTFALLTVAFAMLEERPWWSMIAAGAASTQNPPIAAVLFFICVATVLRDRRSVMDRRVAAGALIGLALALLHPAYTYARHQTPSLLLAATRSGVASVANLTAVLVDPSVGLVGNFPVLLVVAATAAFAVAFQAGVRPGQVRLKVRLKADTTAFRGIAVSIGAAVVFLWSFSRTTNVHHGGTPGLSRYAIWLIPLALPLLAALQRGRANWWRRFLWVSALVSALISVIAFQPSVPENSREPTALATFLWTRVPSLNNPVAEVFSETELHADDLFVPAATRGCEKVLVAAVDGEGGWPVPCYPAPIPAMCQRPDALCYANRSKNGYDFAIAPGGAAGKLRTDAVWPLETIAHVRRVYDAWDWRTLDFGSRDLTVLRQAAGVSVTAIGSDDRFILVLRNVSPAASLSLAPPRRLQGVLIDAISGRAVTTEDCAVQSGEACTVELPAGFRILLLAMRYRGE
jgi:hypothetical protein